MPFLSTLEALNIWFTGCLDLVEGFLDWWFALGDIWPCMVLESVSLGLDEAVIGMGLSLESGESFCDISFFHFISDFWFKSSHEVSKCFSFCHACDLEG